MIEKVARKLVRTLQTGKYLQDRGEEEYLYGTICFLETCASSIVLASIGALFGKLFQTILFLIFFSQIKKRCGGFHAKTYAGCLLGSCAIFVAFVSWICPWMTENMGWAMVFTTICFIGIEWIGAVNHIGMGWSEREYSKSVEISRQIALAEYMIILLLYVLPVHNETVVYIAFSIILNSFLLIIAKFTEEK